MIETQPQPTFRKDYQRPDYDIERVDLRFELDPQRTRVLARMEIRRTDGTSADAPLVLVGEALEPGEVKLDGRVLGAAECTADADGLSIAAPPEAFVLETEVFVSPEANTELSGLYISSGTFCTQCEAEGFRRITWFLDRPDVMARYTTTIVADDRYPVLLSNGNRIESGREDDGRQWVRWEDPFPKPSYLFALVAGDLACHAGSFTTGSRRDVKLEIWVEPANVDRCEHALQSLARAMRWDEEVFGLEYDLDIYMVFAVSDFNMGAMENKGLNVFNAKYVLALPQTATDDDYEGIEGVIGHEYFHNWTGNRVTCRDWFQLTLKEGLTVFRDQLFTADMTSAAVKRISDVRGLRTHQFAEDGGPMAHPVRPDSYVSMDNFYTQTVYRKGAEVVRMYHSLLGAEGFRRGMDLYFERHDGQAVTCSDFLSAMADANERDLSPFERWYEQAGTPTLAVRGTYDAALHTYALQLTQKWPGQGGTPALPALLPVRMALFGPDGQALPLQLQGESAAAGEERVLELREESETFTFTSVSSDPVPSILRDFSAPMNLSLERSREDLAFLFAHDTDPFSRWDAGQTLAQELLLDLADDWQAGRELQLDSQFVDAVRRVLGDPSLDGSLKALALALPGEGLLGQAQTIVNVDGLHAAREFVRRELARQLRSELVATYEASRGSGPYSNDKAAIDRRRLGCTALAYLSRLDEPDAGRRLAAQFESADNMTETQAALALLADTDCPEREPALQAFYERWKHEPLVMDKWFSVQAFSSLPETFERVRALTTHRDYSRTTPNRVYSLLGGFRMNQVAFHRGDGAAYEFFAGEVLQLDALNPQVAARMVSGFNRWRSFDAGRQDLMRAQLERIAAREGLSKDVFEIVSRALAPV